MVKTYIGNLTGSFISCHTLCQSAQTLNQHHAQRSRQGPHFAELEFTNLLVGLEEVHQQGLVKGAVRVSNECPCHTIYTGQPGQGLIQQYWQAAKVAARQTLVDFFELRLYRVKVIQQPLGCGADVIPGAGLCIDIPMGFAQYLNIVFQPWKKGYSESRNPSCPVRCTQALTVLHKPLCTENF